MAELGIIAGGGILLCAVAELTLLPAAIALMDRSGWGVRMPSPLPIHKWIHAVHQAAAADAGRHPGHDGVSVARSDPICGTTTICSTCRPWGWKASSSNAACSRSAIKASGTRLSIADNREELLARKAKFNALPTVERTEEIVSLLPVDDEIKQPIIQRINQRLASLPERPPLIPINRPEKLGEALGQLQALIARTGRAEKCARQLEQIRHLLRSMPLDDCYRSISLFQQQMAGDLLSRLHVLRQVANPDPPN